MFAYRRLALLAMAVCLLGSTRPAAAQTLVDLELVLAVDVSYSMDPEEQRLQRAGYVAALRDPDVMRAIRSGQHGRIAISYFEWAGPSNQNVVLPWTLVDGPEAAEAVAARLAAEPISRLRMTSISGALSFAVRQFGAGSYRGTRRVIDVSGDGPNNAGSPVERIRDEAVEQGIVINGLPIMIHLDGSSSFDIKELDEYYTDCVIGGPGAFMIPIREEREFVSAVRQKLILEVSGIGGPARVVPVQARPKTDCLIGERRWQQFFSR